MASTNQVVPLVLCAITGTRLWPPSRFVEKPDFASVERMATSDRCLWNTEIFLFQLGTLVGEFEAQQRETALSSCLCRRE